MKLRSGRTFRWLGLLGVLIVPYTLVAQKALPLTQSQACTRFGSAVVRIEAGGNSRGTGFIVSPDGFILTASHVVRDASGQYFAAVAVTLPGGKIKLASPAVPISVDNFGQDFALLKVDADIELPFLSLGSTHDVEPGDAGTIIGYPFSALTAQGQNVSTKFCLSAEIAATDIMNVAVNETRPTAKGNFSAERNVKVDVVYFQGPSVKGLSGSPIIAKNTGLVIGIVSQKLTGIGNSLEMLKGQTGESLGRGIAISGLEPGKAVNQILTVLDDQLANGLGAAVGIDDPNYALTKAQKHAKRGR